MISKYLPNEMYFDDSEGTDGSECANLFSQYFSSNYSKNQVIISVDFELLTSIISI